MMTTGHMGASLVDAMVVVGDDLGLGSVDRRGGARRAPECEG